MLALYAFGLKLALYAFGLKLLYV